MPHSPLLAISPVDGRYAEKTAVLKKICSEYGLIYFRVLVEIRWLQHLSRLQVLPELPLFSDPAMQYLETIISNFSEHDALHIKTIERTTNHDVKAVEYFLKEKLSEQVELKPYIEWIHFACTSEDINNLAYALSLQSVRHNVILPLLETITFELKQVAKQTMHVPMLAHTHGQAASPTTVGKEFANVVARLQRQTQQLTAIVVNGKCNGATGNFNAHVIAYPEVDWIALSESFIQSLHLAPSLLTTQIEPHDFIAELSHVMIRIHSILIDFSRDVWGYIALGYAKQKAVANEVGSSTMPHKINPIDFENAEGNAVMANGLFHVFAERLPISRWQRDLVDSTILRNLGVAFAHSVIACQSLLKGLSKLHFDESRLQADLDDNWEVLGEALQTVMRRYGIAEPYEKLKALTRGKKINATDLALFIDNLALPENVKSRLKQLTPATYVGLADQLVKQYLK